MTELRLGQINTVDIDTSEFASANAVNTVQANVTSLDTDVSTISANLNALPDSAANDYTTYSTLSTLIDTVSENASSHSSTFWEGYADTTALAGGYISNGFTVVSGVGAYFGEGGSWTQLATLASVNTVQDNVAALDNNAWVNANDYSTYSTLSSLIDTVQDNVSSQSSNTSIVAGGTDLSNTTVFIEAGDGVLLSSNTTSKTVTIATSMSNVTSQEFTLDGSANSFTLAKSAANTHMILVFYNGIAQKPTSYTISGTTLTLSNTRPIAASSDLEVRYFDFFDLPGVSTSSGGGGSYSFQGENFGYTSGGASPTAVDTIDKFPFSTDSNATDVGEISAVIRAIGAGQSSDTSGYTSGGIYVGPEVLRDVINKFPFSSDTNSTSIGNLTQVRVDSSGQSSSSYGYTSGGGPASIAIVNTIDKFPFSSDTDAADVGDLTQARWFVTGQSSSESGYASAGYTPAVVNTIDKFPFSSDTNATDVGDLTQGRYFVGGQSSTTHGYTSGGLTPTFINTIDKFPFSTDSNATDVGDLTLARQGVVGQSSTSYGYSSGGGNPTAVNTIDKFPFSSDVNATDVGDLTQGRYAGAGQQY